MNSSNNIDRKKNIVSICFLLSFLLLANYFLRVILEQAPSIIFDFLKYFYGKQLELMHSMPWYDFLLPTNLVIGSWTSTSVLMLPFLTKLVGGYGNFYILSNLLFVTVIFLLSWFSFRSYIFSFTIGLCAALTTFNYHVYAVSGSVCIYLVAIYLMFFLFCTWKLFQENIRYFIWWLLWFFTLLLYMLSYESWLDCFFVFWICAPFLMIGLYIKKDYIRLQRFIKMMLALTTLALIYIFLKIHFAYGQINGSESDIVFNYGFKYIVAAIEDIISNIFTMFYTVIITFLPPQLTFSNSIILYGAPKLIELQHNYHAAMSYLVEYNALTLWRFYAGVALTVFVIYWFKAIKKVILAINMRSTLLFIFMTMILFPAATHMLVKFRPMHFLPYMAYHAYFGEMGLMMLIAYIAKAIFDKLQGNKWAKLSVFLIWLDIIFCAFARPPFLSFCGAYVKMGAYPNPWTLLKNNIHDVKVYGFLIALSIMLVTSIVISYRDKNTWVK